MATTYINDKKQSPAYRLPSLGWLQSIPQIIGLGTIKANQLEAIQNFYLEVSSLNRGLDQADKQIGIKDRLDQEHNRNLLKSQNIIDRHEKAKQAAETITKWPLLC